MSSQTEQTLIEREEGRSLTAVFTAAHLVNDQDLLNYCNSLGILEGVQSLGKLGGNLHVGFSTLDHYNKALEDGQCTRLVDRAYTATLYGIPDHISQQEIITAVYKAANITVTVEKLPHKLRPEANSLNRRVTAPVSLNTLPDSLLIDTIEGYTLRSTVVVQGRAPICFRCKERGHYKSACPQNRKQPTTPADPDPAPALVIDLEAAAPTQPEERPAEETPLPAPKPEATQTWMTCKQKRAATRYLTNRGITMPATNTYSNPQEFGTQFRTLNPEATAEDSVRALALASNAHLPWLTTPEGGN